MFHLSRIAWLVAQPLSVAFLATALGFAALLIGLRRTGLALTAAALAVLFVTLFTSAGPAALAALEARYPKPAKDPERLSCMIVLGGAFSSDVNAARGGHEMNQAADRFVEALRLALAFPEAKILVSGGDGSFSGSYDGDAVVAGRFFPAFGIAPGRLLRETTSRNTSENAANTAELVAGAGLGKCLLVTSAFHMPRAVGLMRRAGIPVVPWPTDYRTDGTGGLRLDFTQPTLNAQLTATAMREWLALAVYRAMGRLNEP